MFQDLTFQDLRTDGGLGPEGSKLVIIAPNMPSASIIPPDDFQKWPCMLFRVQKICLLYTSDAADE